MATLDCASSSSTASTIGSSCYDVFLNFRGEDTRRNFTGVLHLFLKEKGFNVFIDSEKLRIGEEIGPSLFRAIEGSRISIPIISERYTSSRWCLQELVRMVQCRKFEGQLILPIFFNVDPSHVRNQTGSFAKDFEEHEKNFDSGIVQSWREALRAVGETAGLVIDENSDQVEVLKLLAKRIMKVLKSYDIPFLEPKFQIGIHNSVSEILPLLDLDSGETRFVGICGASGSGKTTIAKAVYRHILLKENTSHSSFEGHSFLSDIAQYTKQSMGLVALQKQLLMDVLKEEFDIADHHKGKKLVKGKLGKVKVLLVLDDVGEDYQVDALAGALDWFGKGSKIIITTRDQHILNVSKVDRNRIYPPRMLDPQQSLQLFCLHAFPEGQPTDDYMKLAHEVADFSGGLPLTLEVLGKTLLDVEGLDAWRQMISLWKIFPHKEVQGRLKISYDSLENVYQKAIFLDAACFFVGWEKQTVMSIWEACGFFPGAAMDVLVKRSLLKFEKSNDGCLRMHAQIQEMGKAIVREENPMEPSKRSRLCSTDEILEVFEECKGNELIEGMILPLDIPSIYLRTEHFEKFMKIRFLDINSKDFTGDFSRLPHKLRWLRWIGCPWHTLPTNFYHKKLAYLSLSNSVISQAWNIRPPSENKRFQSLKVLDLSDCKNLSKSPNFLWFPCLKDLNLGHCRSLVELDNSIGELIKLEILVLKFCVRLKRLPESIGTLKSLVKLDMTSTSIEELPDNICKLSTLKELILQASWHLKKLPETIDGLQSLVVLKLNGSSRIQELPDSVGRMEKIKELDVEDCTQLRKLPISMGGMRCLENFNLNETNVSKLPDDFSTLSTLVELKIPGGLDSPPADLSHWRKLKILQFCYCQRLEYLPELPSSLVVLCCINCHSLVRLPDLRSLKNLKTLKLEYCPELKEIPGLEGIEWLEELSAPECYNLTYTSRKILGQGRSISQEQELRKTYLLKADNDGICYKGLILCLVLKFDDLKKFEQGESVSVFLDISSCIRQGDKTTRCFHTLRIEDVKYTTEEDIIYIHHFKGFDWFGIPLQRKDSIEIVDIRRYNPYYEHNYTIEDAPSRTVKYWKLLFDDAMTVKDFFQLVSANGTIDSLN